MWDQITYPFPNFKDSVFGFDFRTRYLDATFRRDFQTRYSNSIFGRTIRTDSQTRFTDSILRLDFHTWILNSDKLLHLAHYNGCNYRVATELTENSSLTFPELPPQIPVTQATYTQHWLLIFFWQNLFTSTPKWVNLLKRISVQGDIFHTMKIVDILGEHHAKHEIVLDLTKTASLHAYSCPVSPTFLCKFCKKCPQ